jgi:hypothetical protein
VFGQLRRVVDVLPAAIEPLRIQQVVVQQKLPPVVGETVEPPGKVVLPFVFRHDNRFDDVRRDEFVEILTDVRIGQVGTELGDFEPRRQLLGVFENTLEDAIPICLRNEVMQFPTRFHVCPPHLTREIWRFRRQHS